MLELVLLRVSRAFVSGVSKIQSELVGTHLPLGQRVPACELGVLRGTRLGLLPQEADLFSGLRGLLLERRLVLSGDVQALLMHHHLTLCVVLWVGEDEEGCNVSPWS